MVEKYSPFPAFPPLPYSSLCAPSASLLPYFLLDAYHPNLYGGTGQVADWGMAAAIARRYPILLAGSLTPENVAEAGGSSGLWGVDVSSGVVFRRRERRREGEGVAEAV
ncbi:MAG: hypothetical protein U0401_05415 [Anaerolineae bacterium]